MVNRAPVLTLWAAVVAEILGFDYDSAFPSSSRRPCHGPLLEHGGLLGSRAPKRLSYNAQLHRGPFSHEISSQVLSTKHLGDFIKFP